MLPVQIRMFTSIVFDMLHVFFKTVKEYCTTPKKFSPSPPCVTSVIFLMHGFDVLHCIVQLLFIFTVHLITFLHLMAESFVKTTQKSHHPISISTRHDFHTRINQDDSSMKDLRIGQWLCQSVGRIDEATCRIHPTLGLILPLDYRAYRRFWHADRRTEMTWYLVHIDDQARPFIRLLDETLVLSGNSLEHVYGQLIDRLNLGRTPEEQIVQGPLDAVRFFGLSYEPVVRRIEALSGSELYGVVGVYEFRFHEAKQMWVKDIQHLMRATNATGSARTEGVKQRTVASARATASNSPTIDKSTVPMMSTKARYRLLKQQEAALHYVAKSGIAGFGLYAQRALDPGDMVVEYVGEVIGQALADRREKDYDARKLGCYMFRLKMIVL